MFQKFMAEIFPSDVFEGEEGPWTGSGKKQKWKVDVLNNVHSSVLLFQTCFHSCKTLPNQVDPDKVHCERSNFCNTSVDYTG